MNMKQRTIFNSTFFNFLLGFIIILSISLTISFITGRLDKQIAKAKDAALTIFSGIINDLSN